MKLADKIKSGNDYWLQCLSYNTLQNIKTIDKRNRMFKSYTFVGGYLLLLYVINVLSYI